LKALVDASATARASSLLAALAQRHADHRVWAGAPMTHEPQRHYPSLYLGAHLHFGRPVPRKGHDVVVRSATSTQAGLSTGTVPRNRDDPAVMLADAAMRLTVAERLARNDLATELKGTVTRFRAAVGRRELAVPLAVLGSIH
jgi:hypothetical protein